MAFPTRAISHFLKRVERQEQDDSALFLHYDSQAQDLRPYFWYDIFVILRRFMVFMCLCFEGPFSMDSVWYLKNFLSIEYLTPLGIRAACAPQVIRRSLTRSPRCS